jgi:hypothetical protein
MDLEDTTKLDQEISKFMNETSKFEVRKAQA